MGTAQNIGWGLIGSGTTMLARAATRRAMHEPTGAPRLPRAARVYDGAGMLVLIAAAAGAILAVGDVLMERRKQIARA
jgi:hypothetical protein